MNYGSDHPSHLAPYPTNTSSRAGERRDSLSQQQQQQQGASNILYSPDSSPTPNLLRPALLPSSLRLGSSAARRTSLAASLSQLQPPPEPPHTSLGTSFTLSQQEQQQQELAWLKARQRQLEQSLQGPPQQDPNTANNTFAPRWDAASSTPNVATLSLNSLAGSAFQPPSSSRLDAFSFPSSLALPSEPQKLDLQRNPAPAVDPLWYVEDSSKAFPPVKRRKSKTFPVKLMEAFTSYQEESSSKTNPPCFAWLDDQKSFLVIDKDTFCRDVLQAHGVVHPHSKFESFVRKMNRWGFVRLTSGTRTDCFYHRLFRLGRMDLAHKIRCKPRRDNLAAARKKRGSLTMVTPWELAPPASSMVAGAIPPPPNAAARVVMPPPNQNPDNPWEHSHLASLLEAAHASQKSHHHDDDDEDDGPPSLAGLDKYCDYLLERPQVVSAVASLPATTAPSFSGRLKDDAGR